MPVVRKTITLSDTQDAWIKRQIARGAFTNDSEYIRDLVRRDQEAEARLADLRQARQRGQRALARPDLGRGGSARRECVS